MNDAAVAEFSFGFGPGWYAVPLEPGVGEQWASLLVKELLPDARRRDPARETLEYQLARLQLNLSAMPVANLVCVVWVPAPESGYAAAAAGFALSEIEPGDSPDAVFAAAESEAPVDEDGTVRLEGQPWRGQVEGIGPYVGVRELLSHPDDETPGEAMIEERVICTVFPDGARDAVQLFLSAESIGSFWDIKAAASQLVESLQLTLTEAPA